MAERRARVIRAADGLVPSGVSAAMHRVELFGADDRWLGIVRTEAGVAGGWHHHGARDSYVYVLRGTIAIEFGPGGRDRVVGRPGDLIVNPAWMVHRESTSAEEPGEVFVVRIGNAPDLVTVDGPDA